MHIFWIWKHLESNVVLLAFCYPFLILVFYFLSSLHTSLLFLIDGTAKEIVSQRTKRPPIKRFVFTKAKAKATQHNMQSLKAAWKATTQCNWSNKKTRSGQPAGTVAAGEWENDEQGTVLDNCQSIVALVLWQSWKYLVKKL